MAARSSVSKVVGTRSANPDSRLKHQKPTVRAKRVTRTPKPSTESSLTLEQVREAVEMAWTDAANLPEQPGHGELCHHLACATAVLDVMIVRKVKR